MSLYIDLYLDFDISSPVSRVKIEFILSEILKCELHSVCNRELWTGKSKSWVDTTAREEDVLSEREKIGLKRGLDVVFLYSEHKPCVLTVDFLNELHSHVLFFDFERKGYLRTSASDCVFTYFDSSIHFYPAPEQVHFRLTHICDIVNSMVFEWHRIYRNGSELTVVGLESYIKLCTWTFHSLLSLHCYLDGNGRVARLALAHLISAVNPFPLALSSSSRSTFLHAVTSPRSDGEWSLNVKPVDLCHMVLESWFDSWTMV
jgi:S-adenosylmethionine/arginine decarboxylase-like enzyme